MHMLFKEVDSAFHCLLKSFPCKTLILSQISAYKSVSSAAGLG